MRKQHSAAFKADLIIEVLKEEKTIAQLAAEGGMMGIHGGSTAIGTRYRAWAAANPDIASRQGAALSQLTGYRPTFTHNADTDNWGTFIQQFDQDQRRNWNAVFSPFVEDPVAATLVPTPDEWAQHAAYVSRLVGPDYVGIGLDMFGGRSGVPSSASGYPDLVAALHRIAPPRDVLKVQGENWLRVLDQIFAMAG